MNGDTARYTIGELARRTDLSVKTVRFYSDAGLVPPTDRSEAGYRLYDVEALARLDLVRTLRELGLDLATIRRVLEREVGVAEIAAAHAKALDAQIRTLRLRRAVLRAVAKRGANPGEVQLMHRLARLSAEERRRIIHDFLDEVFGGLSVDPAFEKMMRTATPELPDDPTPEQVDAWVELADLVRDEDFRRRIRSMAEFAAAERAAGRPQLDRHTGEAVCEQARAALAAGIAPDSDEARPVLDRVAASLAAAEGAADDPAFRTGLVDRLLAGTDARAERYWHLLGTINGWPAWPAMVPAFEWIIAALQADVSGARG